MISSDTDLSRTNSAFIASCMYCGMGVAVTGQVQHGYKLEHPQQQMHLVRGHFHSGVVFVQVAVACCHCSITELQR